MYEVGEKQEAFRRAWASLAKDVDNDAVESALVLRKTKDGAFAYYFVGDDVTPYAWIGFLEYIKSEFLNTVYEGL